MERNDPTLHYVQGLNDPKKRTFESNRSSLNRLCDLESNKYQTIINIGKNVASLPSQCRRLDKDVLTHQNVSLSSNDIAQRVMIITTKKNC